MFIDGITECFEHIFIRHQNREIYSKTVRNINPGTHLKSVTPPPMHLRLPINNQFIAMIYLQRHFHMLAISCCVIKCAEFLVGISVINGYFSAIDDKIIPLPNLNHSFKIVVFKLESASNIVSEKRH